MGLAERIRKRMQKRRALKEAWEEEKRHIPTEDELRAEDEKLKKEEGRLKRLFSG